MTTAYTLLQRFLQTEYERIQANDGILISGRDVYLLTLFARWLDEQPEQQPEPEAELP